jgi:hypothetical protein
MINSRQTKYSIPRTLRLEAIILSNLDGVHERNIRDTNPSNGEGVAILVPNPGAIIMKLRQSDVLI